MNQPRIKFVWLLIAFSVASLLVGLLLTPNVPFITEKTSAAPNHGPQASANDLGHNTDVLGLRTAARMREASFTGTSKKSDGKKLPQNLPLDWEDEFFAIFEDNASPDEVDRRLTEFATGRAVGEPRVQLECLRHLAYSLPDDAAKDIAYLAAHNSIPKELREEFLMLAVSARPPQLSEDVRDALLRLGSHELADRISLLSYPEDPN